MFCPYCGTSGPDDAKFCSSCGKNIGVQPSAPAAEPAELAEPAGRDVPTRSIQESRFETLSGRATNPGTAVGQAEDLLRAGSIFAGRYDVVRLIGRGGMGVVYEARDNVINESVALKVLSTQFASRADMVARFTREAKISRQLSHRSIVRVHDMAVHEAAPFISMELVNGVNLRRFFDGRKRQNKPLQIKEILLLARPICDAMAYAHEITIHRDLKPENILVTRDGKVKVSDFGIATLINATESRFTSGGLGTAYYMAPEQLESGRTADQRADIFSLGVILYEAITGKVPAGRFKTPRECRDDVPEIMDEAIVRALDPDPDGRPASMQQFLDYLRGNRPGTDAGFGLAASEDDGSEYHLAPAGPATAPAAAQRADPAAAKEVLAQGKKEQESGDPDKALALLDQAVKLDPNLPEAWFQRALALAKAKLGTDPDEKWRRVAAGRITLDEVQATANEVVANMKKAQELEPGNGMYMMAATLAEKQLKQTAGKLVATPAGQQSGKAAGGGLFGRLLGGSGAGGGVEELMNEGNVALSNGNIDAAIRNFDQAIKKDKRCAAAWYGKGMALGKKLGSDQAEMFTRIASGQVSVEEAQRIGEQVKVCLRKAAQLEPGNALYTMVASQIK